MSCAFDEKGNTIRKNKKAFVELFILNMAVNFSYKSTRFYLKPPKFVCETGKKQVK
jgi:predicted AAA+ superfamily ATPase